MKYIFALVLVALMAASAFCAPLPLKNGIYTMVHLIANTPEAYQVDLRNNHRGVVAYITTYGCDAPVTLYASSKSEASSSNYQWTTIANVSDSSFLDISQKDLNDADQLFLTLTTPVTSPCTTYLVAHVKHTLNLIQLEDSVPQFGAFQPNTQVPALYHFLEFDLGGNDSRLDSLGFMVTNLHARNTKDTSNYKLYVSNTNSRPIEGKATWSGISTSNGDSAIVINRQDPSFVDSGKYWVGVEFQSSGPFQKDDDPHYSVVVHPNFGARRSNLDKPIHLLDKIPQFALGNQGSFTYFSLYVDKAVAGKILNVSAKTEYGDVLIYVSSKTSRPDRNNFDFRGGKSVEFQYSQAAFVYVAVEALPHASGLAAFELVFNRA